MSQSEGRISITKEDALKFHMDGKPGKIAISPTKPLDTVRDLALAYSPGVAFPCLEIEKNPDSSYDYTSKGNMVAVISNGTAVLGLGNLGSAASKPVMEGKSVLFKRFANIDSIDVEVDLLDKEKIIETIAAIGESWGGINLEDIRSPECFEIEAELKKRLNIPVFHDDQHGTAIITLAGLINACEITNRTLDTIKVVVNGSGAAGLACLDLLLLAGVKLSNVFVCDSVGVIYKGRTESMSAIKERYAVETKARSLSDAMNNADVFLGLSVKDVVNQDMVKSMAKNPIIFAMANPDPEIKPELVHAVRSDAIVATGRSDYPNQVNNVMGFPYIFRGALDVRASNINEEMKLAAAHAIAKLVKEPIPNEVTRAYPGRELKFGPSYIIPTPFDPRLIVEVSAAVAKAAMDTGVARKEIKDFDAYKRILRGHRNPTLQTMQIVHQSLSNTTSSKKKIIFAEGEEPEVIKAAIHLANEGYAVPVLVGRADKIHESMKNAGILNPQGLEIANAAVSKYNDEYTEYLYTRMQRQGLLRRDCERLVKTDRNIFASCMLALGHGDSLITGFTRSFKTSFTEVAQVIDIKEDGIPFAVASIVHDNKTIFISDVAINEDPSAEELAFIAIKTAEIVKTFGYDPRVAFVSYSNFGSRDGYDPEKIREAIEIMDCESLDFEYDGEIMVNVAISNNPREFHPFNKLSGPANILIMPNLSSANAAFNLLESFSGAFIIGPILQGFEKNVQIMRYHSDVNSITNLAALSLVM